MGPVEVLVVGFPRRGVGEAVLPELRSLVEQGVIRVVDGIVVQKDANEEIRCLEFEETAPEDDTRRLGELFDETLVELLSDRDGEEIATAMAPDSSAAILVFEHTWATSLRDAINTAGGSVLADFRVPNAVVNEVLTSPAGTGGDNPNGRS